MTLYIIGIGLNDEKDITLRGLEIVKRCKQVFLENYTSVINCPISRLEDLYGKKLILANRELVEQRSDKILENASEPGSDVAFLVIGDPMSATTHIDLVLRAKEKGIEVKVVNNASVLTAIGIVGLELYKYGKTTSIVFPQEGWTVEAHYDAIKQNKKLGLHTLCLLDIKTEELSKEDIRKELRSKAAGQTVVDLKPQEPMFMTINEAIENLLDIETRRKEKVFTDKTSCVGCSRLGSFDVVIKSGTAGELLTADFGKPLHCLIIPGDMQFMEEAALKQWAVGKNHPGQKKTASNR
jgi:diphthine methyl ester synthase